MKNLKCPDCNAQLRHLGDDRWICDFCDNKYLDKDELKLVGKVEIVKGDETKDHLCKNIDIHISKHDFDLANRALNELRYDYPDAPEIAIFEEKIAQIQAELRMKEAEAARKQAELSRIMSERAAEKRRRDEIIRNLESKIMNENALNADEIKEAIKHLKMLEVKNEPCDDLKSALKAVYEAVKEGKVPVNASTDDFSDDIDSEGYYIEMFFLAFGQAELHKNIKLFNEQKKKEIKELNEEKKRNCIAVVICIVSVVIFISIGFLLKEFGFILAVIASGIFLCYLFASMAKIFEILSGIKIVKAREMEPVESCAGFLSFADNGDIVISDALNIANNSASDKTNLWNSIKSFFFVDMSEAKNLGNSIKSFFFEDMSEAENNLKETRYSINTIKDREKSFYVMMIGN